MKQENQLTVLGTSEINIHQEIYDAMKLLYHGIVKVELDSGHATVLCSSEDGEAGKIYDWKEYLQTYVNYYVLPSDHTRLFYNFSTEHIRQSITEGKRSFSGEFSSYPIGKNEQHITMLAFMPETAEGRQYAYVMVRNTGGDYLLNSIVNQYVYSTCDYFIYLDAKHNCYTMFSGQSGTPLPPEICMDYEKALVDYARAFVVKEDQEMVIREMHLPRVLEQLDKNGIHSFTCGVNEAVRGYTRKRLDYRYHDRENQMILLSRTDITDIYLEEEEKRKELEKALKRAQTDPLTKLLNFQATMDAINDSLSQNEKSYALFFIDLDNFKQINDTYGHPVGDQVLQNISGSLKAVSYENDIVGRVGGDEFVFFTEVNGTQSVVEVIAQKICYAINAVKIHDSSTDRLSGSVGIAVSPADGLDYYTMVKKADTAAYKAKKNGKNQYSF